MAACFASEHHAGEIPVLQDACRAFSLKPGREGMAFVESQSIGACVEIRLFVSQALEEDWRANAS